MRVNVESLAGHLAHVRKQGRGIILVACAPGDVSFISIAREHDLAYVNASEEVALRLLEWPDSERRKHVQEALTSIVEAQPHEVGIGRLGLLFLPILQFDPVQALRNLARHRIIVAEWNGAVNGTTLAYAKPGHGESR